MKIGRHLTYRRRQAGRGLLAISVRRREGHTSEYHDSSMGNSSSPILAMAALTVGDLVGDWDGESFWEKG